MADTATTSTDATAHTLPSLLPRGAVLFDAGDVGGCWRVQRGIVRLDRPTADGPVLVMLALPGDWLGADSLCHHPHQWRATAVTPVSLQPCAPRDEVERRHWLVEALLQLPQRCHDMARLRTGPVAARLAAFLALLQGSAAPLSVVGPSDVHALREALPPLRVLADLVDAKHETVCRVLGQLLPRSREGYAMLAAA
ncbi:cyclic nucleotide-binding domain-containing protein [Tepidimonas charontis]|uniref:Transcriptional regulator SdrP n=1 Tax=Tepidimonas charontis TaxID=2267262 RepID=A0A554X0Z6_9BURK|nr:cyclic nucleotide-binding domain-containing protein [Tepidimonas charontis]TSE29488.1 Transcriptional regulator SdrP [Tepidimonas charontis]